MFCTLRQDLQTAWPAHRHETDLRMQLSTSVPMKKMYRISRGFAASNSHRGLSRSVWRYRNRLSSMLSVRDRRVGHRGPTGKLKLDNVLRLLSVMACLESIASRQPRLSHDETISFMAIRGPGVPAGERIEHLAMNSDLAVTLAGGVARRSGRGRKSLAPLLPRNKPSLARGAERLASSTQSASRRRAITGFVGTDKTAASIHYETQEEELYDTELDPYELASRHGSIDLRTRETLQTWTTALADCREQECRPISSSASRN
jgi:hypothetical protein